MSEHTVTLPYKSPRERTVATVRRQLAIDAVVMLLSGLFDALGQLPQGQPIHWDALALVLVSLLLKTTLAAALKYQSAIE